ncbi:MAG: glycine cleavage system protein T [Hyphomicrobiales bacterium]|nr:MAG: glycine cleavage system protein T [Hyphomicrobiales bacterium]
MSDTTPSSSETLSRTPLYDLHVAAGARMVPFAGYEMPVQYEGIIAEHTWTRSHAGLFDVSHMGQARLDGPDYATLAAALEALCAADVVNLAKGRQRYSQLLNDEGGIVDDLMFRRPEGDAGETSLLLVVNAARKDVDYALLNERLPANVKLTPLDLALIALQGPEAATVLSRLLPGVEDLAFMAFGDFSLARADGAAMALNVIRAGYTGEDGYEISVAPGDAAELWQRLTAEAEVKPVGLGARDSLRLECGLCLYGHDIDETTSPVEGGLVWSMQKRRREEGGFPGAARIQKELAEGPSRLRVGIKPEGRAPAREGTEVQLNGQKIGVLTSGGFGPTVSGPVAMGYVDAAHAASGTAVDLIVRGKAMAATIVDLPFVPQRYYRKPKA